MVARSDELKMTYLVGKNTSPIYNLDYDMINGIKLIDGQ